MFVVPFVVLFSSIAVVHPVKVVQIAVAVVVLALSHDQLAVLDEPLKVVLSAGSLIDGCDAVGRLSEAVVAGRAVRGADAQISRSSICAIGFVAFLQVLIYLLVVPLDVVFNSGGHNRKSSS